MTDKILLVTEPDDVKIDGLRLLLVDLTDDQSQVISTALGRLNTIHELIIYSSQSSSIDWVLDKKAKSKLCFFNADSDNHLLVGYLAAQSNGYYFGNLKILSQANKRVIYNVDDVVNLLTKTIGTYE
jgi:hypothetical protein